MPQMRGNQNALGALLREHRRKRKVGFKQLSAATGLEPETLRKWEVGEIQEPPLRAVLIYAHLVGLPIDELVRVAVPVICESSDPADRLAAIQDSADVASARAAAPGTRSRRR